MCKPCTNIIIVQIMIDSVKLHSIIIYKHGMDLKLYALTFEVKLCNIYIYIYIYNPFYYSINFEYKVKHIVQTISNKHFLLLKQKVITKMMNHKNKILSSKTLCFHILMFLNSILNEIWAIISSFRLLCMKSIILWYLVWHVKLNQYHIHNIVMQNNLDFHAFNFNKTNSQL
jgi:hypothetical protein